MDEESIKALKVELEEVKAKLKAKQDKKRELRKRWKQNNKEKVREEKKRWARKNRQKMLEYKRQWREKNKDKVREQNNRHREKVRRKTEEEYLRRIEQETKIVKTENSDDVLLSVADLVSSIKTEII